MNGHAHFPSFNRYTHIKRCSLTDDAKCKKKITLPFRFLIVNCKNFNLANHVNSNIACHQGLFIYNMTAIDIVLFCYVQYL